MSRSLVAGLFGFLLCATPAQAQYIGIFLDEDARTCAADVGAAPYIQLHVVAVLGPELFRMTGAQFQITGVPESWTPENAVWVPDAGTTLSLGHPLFENPVHDDTPGVNVAFGICQSLNHSETVPLGRIVLLGAPTPDSVHLRVEGFQLSAIDPLCPLMTACTSGHGAHCVEGREIVLNGNETESCSTTPVAPVTWSAVKSLYE